MARSAGRNRPKEPFVWHGENRSVLADRPRFGATNSRRASLEWCFEIAECAGVTPRDVFGREGGERTSAVPWSVPCVGVSRTRSPWTCRMRRPCGPLGGRRFAVRAGRRVGRTSRVFRNGSCPSPVRAGVPLLRARVVGERGARGTPRGGVPPRGRPGACIPAGSVGTPGFHATEDPQRSIASRNGWRAWNRRDRTPVFLGGACSAPFFGPSSGRSASSIDRSGNPAVRIAAQRTPRGVPRRGSGRVPDHATARTLAADRAARDAGWVGLLGRRRLPHDTRTGTGERPVRVVACAGRSR